MTLEEALEGKEIPDEIRNNLTLVNVPYFSFDGEVREGQLVVHKEVADEVQQIFQELLGMRFPIQQIIPIIAYDWNDDASMAANNTSAFNYRLVHGTNQLSNHSFGRAIDINPVQNQYTRRDGVVMPLGAKYDPTQLGTITTKVASLFKSYGWNWAGEWPRKDYQHFQKI
jgi:hypothetical protein